MKYWALMHPSQPSVATSLLLVNKRRMGIDVIVFNRRTNRWESRPSMVRYLVGDDSHRSLPLSRRKAAALAFQLGTTLPNGFKAKRLTKAARAK